MKRLESPRALAEHQNRLQWLQQVHVKRSVTEDQRLYQSQNKQADSASVHIIDLT